MRSSYNAILGKMGADKGHEWAERLLMAGIAAILLGVAKIGEIIRGGGKGKKGGGKEKSS